MTEPQLDLDQPWDTLTEELVALTERLRRTYAGFADGGPSEEEIRQALATLASAWGQVAEAVGAALGDEEMRGHFKRAGRSLASAVGAGLSELIAPGPTGADREVDGTQR